MISGPLSVGFNKIANSSSTPSTTVTGVTTAPISTGATHPSPFSLATSSLILNFPKNHQLWDSGDDILALQQFLNAHGFSLVQTGWGSPGKETNTFGPHTYAALVEFQQANNLPATGFFGPLPRAILDSTIAASTAQ